MFCSKRTPTLILSIALGWFMTNNLWAQSTVDGPPTSKTFQVFIDRDADPNTGFDPVLNDGVSVARGVELRLTIYVNPGPIPRVTAVEAQEWDEINNIFGPVYFRDASGWPVGSNNGTNGSDVVEGYLPLDQLGITQNVNFFVQSGDLGVNFDLMDPTPFMFSVQIPTLSQWMLMVYVGLLLLAALWVLRRRRNALAKGSLIALLGLSLMGVSTTIILDGQINDWQTPANATDPVNDAGEDAIDLLAFFVAYDNRNLYVRLDVEELENQGPVAVNQSVSLLEDASLIISLSATDPNGDPLLFTVDTPPTNGALSAVTSTGNNSADVTYTPNADFSGSDGFTFMVDDQNGGTALGTIGITVDPVNDAPVFTAGAAISVTKDTGPQVFPNWATGISAGPVDETGQSLSFQVLVTSNPGVFTVAPAIDANGTLTFTPDDDDNGSANLEIVLMDDGGTANGGVDTSPQQTVTITIGAVNDPPSFTAGPNQSHNEDDGAIVVNGWATAMSPGPPDEAGQVLTFNTNVISNLGSIFSVAPAVDATTGTLTYTLASDAFGSANIELTLMDDGGTANGGVDTSPVHTLTVTVNAVNDAPSFANSGNVSVFKSGGPEIINGWASMLSTGPANESSQSITGFNVIVISDLNSVLANTPSVDPANGNLSFMTTVDNNGTATISITAMDDGGTANGGVDTSPAAMIDINVGAVNDPPSFTAGADQVHNEDAGLIIVNGWATALSPGPPDEVGQLLTFNAAVINNPGNIFSVAPAVDATTGTLTYTLAPDAFGVATVELTLMDDGGTANGGVDTSPAHTLTIAVNAVNDAPSFTNTGNITVINTGITQVINAWASMLSTGPANESSQSLTGFSVNVTSDPSTVLTAAPTVDVITGNLSFNTTPGNSGSATLSVTLMDDGGTANGGVPTSAAAVITITVNPVNLPPVANDDSFDAAVHTRFEVGVTTPAPGHKIAGSVLTSGTPDSDPDVGTTLIVTGTSNLTPGADLNMNANGTFTLVPPVNTTTGTVSFDYTISDQHPTLPLTDTATVTITLFDPVWYVKNDHPGPSQGTSENPFQTLAEAEAAAASNHKIFVFTGDGTTTGQNAGITLQDGQSLIGQRVDLVLDINGSASTILTGSGMATSAPNLGNASGDVVTLADDNIVRGLTLLPTASAGVAGVGIVPMKQAMATWSKPSLKYLDRLTPGKRAGGTTIISDVLITPSGGSDGLVLLGQEGSFTFTNSEISGLPGNTGIGLNVDNSMATFTFDGLTIGSLGRGIQLNANTNAIDFTNTDVTNCSDSAIHLQDQDNASFANTCSVNQTGLGSALTVVGGSGSLSFNGPMTVNDVTTGTAISLNGLNANPTINFGALTLDVVSGTHAIEIMNMGATSDINFNGVLDINDAGSDGLNMNAVNGSVDITNAASDIASAGSNGVFILGGAPTVTYNGTMTNNTLSVFLRSITGGSTAFNGLISQEGGTNGYRVSSCAGTHSVLRANWGTLANRVSENGIRIFTSTGTFNFTDFTIFSSEAGIEFNGSSETMNILPASTTAAINSLEQAINHDTGGTLNGTFTNIVANTTGTLFSGIELQSGGGGTLTFMDMDIDTSGGDGIFANTAYNFVFTPASTITIDTNSGRGLFLVNGTYVGQIDRLTVAAGTVGGVFLSAMAGNLEFGLVNLVTTGTTNGFRATNSGTLSVTDNASRIQSTGGTALSLNNIFIGAGNMTFADIRHTNAGFTRDGIFLATLSGGTLTVNNTTVDTTMTGGNGIEIDNSSATFVFNGGDLDTTADTAIDLTNNAGATFTFNNMDIDTTTGTGFDAAGGGTITGSGTNTINTTTGRGIQIDGTNIGAGNFSFQSISTNGAVNGIRLNDTGNNGGLIVTGTGADDSGGTIQNSTGNAIVLDNTNSVSLTDMQVNNSTMSHIFGATVIGLTLNGIDFTTSGFHGIDGFVIVGLNMSNCTLDSSGNSANEHGIRIQNLLGESSIRSCDFTRSATIHASIQNISTLAAVPAPPNDILTFDDCSFSMPVAGTFGDNISVEAGNTGNLRLILDDTVGQNTFVGGQDGVQAATSTGGTLDVIVDNINVQNGTGGGVNLAGSNASTLTFDVRNISTLNMGSTGINATSIGGATMSGVVDNNTINGSTAGQGIQVITEGNGDITATISNNDIDNIDAEHGIRVQARAGTSTINATIDSNDVNLAASLSPLEGIYVESGSSAGGDSNTICLNLLNNTSVSNSDEGFRLRHRAGTTLNLQDFVGVGSNPADVTTWINTTKSNTGTTQITGTGFTASGGPCPTP